MKNILLISLVSICSAIVAVSLYKYFEEPQVKEVLIREEVPVRYTNFDEKATASTNISSAVPSNFVSAAESVTPAVVNIRATAGNNADYWWGNSSGASTGSGVIVSSDGYIVTNNHVIESATNIEVTTNDKRIYEAELIGFDSSTDIALIKIKEKNLPFLEMADSDASKIGEWVLAVGNPFNLTSTVTAGIISAKGRNIEILEGRDAIESFIQTDAVVNPGNSGGALVNLNGNLIGINTAIITKSGRYEGYSFAVPSNLVRKVIRDLKEYGKVQRGYLGVDITDVNAQIAERLSLKAVEGIYISRVRSQSGAEEGGLKKGDVITRVNGNKVKSVPELQEQIARLRPGNSVNIGYIREGALRKATIQLKDQYNLTTITKKSDSRNLLADLGFQMRNLTGDEKRRLKLSGVKVLSVTKNSKIGRTNMDPNYIITKVNEERVETVEDVLNAIKKATGKIMLEGVYEDYKGEYYYAFAK